MGGGHVKRFCTVCDRSVYDLSVFTRRQAAELLKNNAGKVCGRISYDQRGNQIFAKGVNPLERLVQISILGASAALTATAAPDCALKVRVVDPSGATIPRANVEILNADDGKTASNGVASEGGELEGQIAPGTFSLQVQSPGFASSRQEFSCHASESVSVEVPLQVGSTDMGEIIAVQPARPSVAARLRSLFRRHY